ncbi:Retinal-specific ATP-binding cassette transporter [Symbiodinium microadriaticum]|uniref:Retinal-specific ATP-binding cassette transporter n=1 Tax=Symbiodinium microadriaticum TaxID=2951 RepID=A0A1Q9DUI6_SYMMI|nr:Retinal-specific ATP-binding cassette transporter [Symbiodinium microadriaticum]
MTISVPFIIPNSYFPPLLRRPASVPLSLDSRLLGVNGAGKTTTMRMITGKESKIWRLGLSYLKWHSSLRDTEVTNGDILVGGASVQVELIADVSTGNSEALPDKLTVRETLSLYARIRGCAQLERDISKLGDSCVPFMGALYQGGVPRDEVAQVTETMVRKMCLEALALIGEPDVVLLDEPSTGVDIIGDIRLNGHAVVLTSHSMEDLVCGRPKVYWGR